MKKIIAIILLLMITNYCMADRVKTTDYFHVTGSIIDTLPAGTELTPDSVFIATYKGSATPVFSGWFNTGDAQCAAAANNGIVFFDTYSDIDGAGGDGSYYTTAEFYEADRGIYHITENWWEVGNLGIDWSDIANKTASNNLTNTIIGTVTDLADSAINEASIKSNTMTANKIATAAITNPKIATNTITSSILAAGCIGASEIADSAFDEATFQSNTITNAKIAARAFDATKHDTAAVAAFYDFVIWLDDGASNTNTVLGVDGMEFKPVSTLAAARTLADAAKIHQYNILNASSFTLDATYENWVFHDIGHNSTVNLNSQDVDNSTFEELIVTGTQGGNGTISLIDCDIVNLHDFDGEALFCWLVDSLVMDNNSEAYFGNCYSSVAGNGTPKIDFHVASNNISFRNYSGGINIVGMSSNDGLSIEGNGQVIVDATCSNAPITVRGNFTITDNGSGTVWTRQAVFNWKDISDGDYAGGIWVDDGAANTNTTAYVDGTIVNPVSTLAAAKTLADAIGFRRYYFINNSNLTLAATHEDWEFIGVGEGNLINFGSQDIDNSHFEHLMISGTQGGTGVIGIHGCYLNTIDSLEAIVTNSSYSDTISLRVSTNTVFDGCYSHVAGNATPGLDFNSTGTINVDMRHYSGGLALFNMTSSHTISYESDGQLVIDGSCTSANITTRGNMDITNNGTTINLTDNAVFNKTDAAVVTSQHVKDSIFFQDVSVGNYATVSPDSFLGRANLNWLNISGSGGVTVDNMENDVVSGGAVSSAAASKIGAETWQNIDTTNTIDTSDVGDWFRNNVGGGGDASPSAWDATDSNVVASILADTIVVVSDTFYTGEIVAVMPSSGLWSSADSAGYQGSASGLSAAEIADTLTNRGMSTGGGSEPETLIVLNSADSTSIQDARPQVYTLNQVTGKVTTLTTDVNGILICFLGDGVGIDSFFVRTNANNYVQTTDTIAVASGGGTDTLFMQAFDPGSPSSADLSIVYGWVYDIHGDSVKGAEVTAQIMSDSSEVGLTSDGVWVNTTSYRRTTKTDVNGKFSIELYKTSALSDTSSTYLFSIKLPSGRIVRLLSDVPDSSTFKLKK